METESRWMEATVGMENDRFVGRGLFWVMKMCWNLTEAVVAQHFECSKCHWIVPFKIGNFSGTFHLIEFFKLSNNIAEERGKQMRQIENKEQGGIFKPNSKNNNNILFKWS